MSKFTSQQKKKLKKVARREEFTQRFGNVENLIRDWNLEYENLTYVVPLDLHLKIEKLHSEAREIYRDFVDKSSEKDSFDRFDKIIAERIHTMEKITAVIAENAKKRFACPRSIGIWLRRNEKVPILTTIKRDGGILTKETIVDIFEPYFVKRFVPEFNIMLRETGFAIKPADHRFLVTYDWNGPSLQFNLEASALMGEFGGLLFDASSQITAKELLNCNGLSLTDHIRNFALIDYLNQIIRGSNYHVSYIGNDYQLVKRDSDEYADKLTIIEFLNHQKARILSRDSSTKAEIVEALRIIQSWRPLTDLEKYDVGDISKKPNF